MDNESKYSMTLYDLMRLGQQRCEVLHRDPFASFFLSFHLQHIPELRFKSPTIKGGEGGYSYTPHKLRPLQRSSTIQPRCPSQSEATSDRDTSHPGNVQCWRPSRDSCFSHFRTDMPELFSQRWQTICTHLVTYVLGILTRYPT